MHMHVIFVNLFMLQMPMNRCYRGCAQGQGLLCLQLRVDEAKGPIQWKMIY